MFVIRLIKILMKVSALSFAFVISLPVMTHFVEAGDIEYGRYLASECNACHSSNKKTTSGIPSINGKPAGYLVDAIRQYKNKSRNNSVMQMIAGRLNDKQITSLAAYFSALKLTQ